VAALAVSLLEVPSCEHPVAVDSFAFMLPLFTWRGLAVTLAIFV